MKTRETKENGKRICTKFLLSPTTMTFSIWNSFSGYFILCLKRGTNSDRIKLVNSSQPVLKLLSGIIGRHCVITKSGWDRHLAYSFKLQKRPGNSGRHALILLTSEVLLTLYKTGWEPMTPIDLCVKGLDSQTAICFRKSNQSGTGTPMQVCIYS